MQLLAAPMMCGRHGSGRRSVIHRRFAFGGVEKCSRRAVSQHSSETALFTVQGTGVD